MERLRPPPTEEVEAVFRQFEVALDRIERESEQPGPDEDDGKSSSPAPASETRSEDAAGSPGSL